MKRRKFLIGAGSLAAAGAAAMGTGAFTSVKADRNVQVSVADDADAFLSIERDTEGGNVTPNAAEYVEISNQGTVALDFTQTDDTTPQVSSDVGSGLNKNATTVIDNLLQIKNQGTQEVIVGYRSTASPGANFALYEEDSNLGNNPNDGQLNIDTAGSINELPKLKPGETLKHVGAFFFGDVDVSAINNSDITFVAADEPEDL